MIYILHYVCFLVPLPAIMLTKNSILTSEEYDIIYKQLSNVLRRGVER